MTTVKTLCAMAIAILLAGCGSMPTTATTRADNPPMIVIDNAPEGSVVRIDGEQVGVVAKKDNSFATSSGRHTVSVQTSGMTILTEDIFVQDGTTRVLRVN